MFIAGGLVRAEVTDLLPGSGVDLSKFSALPQRTLGQETHKFRFILIARMLWDKGVGEYVQAAKQIHQRWPQTECCLLGFLDVLNPGAITKAEMDDLVAQGWSILGSVMTCELR